MSDLETRLTEALHAGSESAPEGAGLAEEARARARTRRRARMAAAGAVAVAALAVPVAVVAMAGDGGSGKAPVADKTTATDLEPVETGRWESWHGVTVLVPEDWEYGDQSAWCADGRSVETFRVTRPGGVSEMLACTPMSSYGLSFQEIDDREPFDWPVVKQTGDAWPPGTYVGAHGENRVLVTVAGPDREELLDVLATIRTVDDVDPNGCPLGDDPTVTGDADSMSVCRYDGSRGILVQSERLVGDDVDAALAALDAAPETTYAPPCPEPVGGPEQVTQYVVMLHDGTRYSVAWEGEQCRDHGVFVDVRERRTLTADVLYWALSPGWTGSVDGNVPLPDQLRRRSGEPVQ